MSWHNMWQGVEHVFKQMLPDEPSAALHHYQWFEEHGQQLVDALMKRCGNDRIENGVTCTVFGDEITITDGYSETIFANAEAGQSRIAKLGTSAARAWLYLDSISSGPRPYAPLTSTPS